jgi:hypothetical protein
LLEGCEPILAFLIARRPVHQHADASRAFGLLGGRRERPSCSEATDNPNEIPAPHRASLKGEADNLAHRRMTAALRVTAKCHAVSARRDARTIVVTD